MRVLYINTVIDRGECYSILGLNERGIKPIVVCDPASDLQHRLRQAGISVHHIAFRAKRDRAAIAELRQLIESTKPHIVHVYRKIALSNVLISLRGLPQKLVAYRGIVGNLSFLDPGSWMSFLNPRVYRIICAAEAIRQDLLKTKAFGLHVPPDKLITIHKGHETDWYTRDGKADLGGLGIPAGSKVIGCVANMRPRKGVPVLVKAFESLQSDFDAHLLLVGRIDDKKIIRSIAASPARERIHALGFRPDAPALAGAVDVFVLPTLRREGLPRSVIEAMSQAVPSVVTDAGGSAELIEDRVSGRVVLAGNAEALAEALREILTDPAVAERYGQAGQRRIRDHFNVAQTVDKTLAVYNELLSTCSNRM